MFLSALQSNVYPRIPCTYAVLNNIVFSDLLIDGDSLLASSSLDTHGMASSKSIVETKYDHRPCGNSMGWSTIREVYSYSYWPVGLNTWLNMMNAGRHDHAKIR